MITIFSQQISNTGWRGMPLTYPFGASNTLGKVFAVCHPQHRSLANRFDGKELFCRVQSQPSAWVMVTTALLSAKVKALGKDSGFAKCLDLTLGKASSQNSQVWSLCRVFLP
jgi:hypothetical protein